VVVLERQVGVSAPLDDDLVVVDPERRLDRGVGVAAGVDERPVEVCWDAVGLDREDAVAGRGEPVVARQLPRARVLGAHVLVAASPNDFFQFLHARP